MDEVRTAVRLTHRARTQRPSVEDARISALAPAGLHSAASGTPPVVSVRVGRRFHRPRAQKWPPPGAESLQAAVAAWDVFHARSRKGETNSGVCYCQ